MRIPRFAATFVLSIGLLAPAVAQAQDVTVNQGDLIRVADHDGRYNCTAGFIDKENGRVWTAGHCAYEGANVFNGAGVPIGLLKHLYPAINPNHSRRLSNKDIADYFFHDTAYVQLNQGIVAGENLYSGDRTYAPEIGDKICRYGATTADAIYCGKVLNVTDQLIYATDLNTQGGDSGGPTWVPEQGYTGQAVGSFTYRSSDGRPYVLSVIHRADLAGVIEQYDEATRGTAHYQPSYNQLLPSFQRVANRQEVFGKQLPSAQEFDKYLREYEQAKARISELEAQLEAQLENQGNQPQAPDNTAELEAQLAKAREDLAVAQAELDNARENRELAKKLEQQLQQSQAEHKKYKAETETGMIIAIISAILGLVAAVAGWLSPQIKLPF
ncbi:hypothetical protein [Corynebacterium phocae]|uniref:hypothetical protein n=1 Tax=Corynebacterium phocae TaxID=161895 RepID=UPI0009521F55|nr:hypothetical protein [Corynebacterium phocae]KAA8720729.1 hypothetical protein F4V58_12315 [Corynebacterium phocae]